MLKKTFFLAIISLFFPLISYAGDLTLPVYQLNITSFFDHNVPDYTENDNFVKYDTNQWTDGSASESNCALGVNCYDGHNGVDFDGESADDILSATFGIVREQYWNNCGGNTMRVWHSGQGYSSLYAHLLEDSYLVGTGDDVGRLEHIADMGQTGSCVDGDHLHFGIADGDSLSNKRADPFSWEGHQDDPCQQSQDLCIDLGYLWTTDPPSFDLGGNYNVINVTEDITEDTTWEYGNVYVILENITISAYSILTINPGVIVKSDTNGRLDVYGSLLAQGTSAQKIYFTSYKDDTVGGDSNGDDSNSVPAPADWASISVYPGGYIDLFHVVVRYGGRVIYNCDTCKGSLYTAGGELTISDSLIEKNNYGVYLHNGTVDISQSSINQNSDYGVYHTGAGTTTATNNWWGDFSGPFHPIFNPNGEGDRVSGNVEFIPWLSKPIIEAVNI